MSRQSVLTDLVKRNGWKAGAEVGVYDGRTFLHLLEHCPALTLTGVDRWIDDGGTPGHVDRDTGEASYAGKSMAACEAAVREKAKRFGDRARLIKGDSSAVAIKLSDWFDFVFIDADHATDSVLKDIAAWRLNVLPGGYLLGHDINWPSVRRAVDMLLPGWVDYGSNVWGIKL